MKIAEKLIERILGHYMRAGQVGRFALYIPMIGVILALYTIDAITNRKAAP